MLELFLRLGLKRVNHGAAASGWIETSGESLASINPTTGDVLAHIKLASRADYAQVVSKTREVFERWKMVPAPARGEIVREVGEALRAHKTDLARLMTLEVGKVRAESEGEVQEAIDMADFACGLSRQLYGQTMHSERPRHRMYEQWHPLGVVGIITAFNFPCAVWSWNALIAAVCGDTMIWKPSLKAPLTAIAVHQICDEVFTRHGWGGVLGLVIGHDHEVGEALIRDRQLPLISATGSCRMGRHVNSVVAGRLGRCLLELGGNNAVIVNRDASLELALRAVVFGAVGTAGQRCTSTRRLFVHKSIAEAFVVRLKKAYGSIVVGDPGEAGVLCGPLIDEDAVVQFEEAVSKAVDEGGEVVFGGRRVERAGSFVEPTLINAGRVGESSLRVMSEETFAPILYIQTFDDLGEALAAQNSVDQGLSSALFTDSISSAERFLSHGGSDCGIANINIGTSGAEIGGAFGGEKDTGGGREAGSDAWKAYMRRQTCTLNWSGALPLAQGVTFDVDV